MEREWEWVWEKEGERRWEEGVGRGRVWNDLCDKDECIREGRVGERESERTR